MLCDPDFAFGTKTETLTGSVRALGTLGVFEVGGPHAVTPPMASAIAVIVVILRIMFSCSPDARTLDIRLYKKRPHESSKATMETLRSMQKQRAMVMFPIRMTKSDHISLQGRHAEPS